MRTWTMSGMTASDGRRLNIRNGMTLKRVKGTFDEVEVATPRDRAGTFEPSG